MERVNRELTVEGYIAVAPGVFPHCGDELDNGQKAQLDLLHLAKVEMADLVVVVKGSSATRKASCDQALVARLLGLAKENAALICGRKVAIPLCDASCWVEFKAAGSSKCEEIAPPKDDPNRQTLDKVAELVMKVAHETERQASQ